METIYSDLRAEVLTTELGERFVQIYDTGSTRRNPTLVLPNILCAVMLHDYLDKIIQKSRKE